MTILKQTQECHPNGCRQKFFGNKKFKIWFNILWLSELVIDKIEQTPLAFSKNVFDIRRQMAIGLMQLKDSDIAHLEKRIP